MSVFWSPTAPARQKPGGIFWWAEAFANMLASLQQPKASINSTVADLAVLGATISKLTANLAGVMHPTGVLVPALQKPAAALAGAQAQSGSLVAPLALPLGASLTAQEIEQGVLSASLQKPAAALAGAQAQVGSVVVALQQLSAAVAGSEQPQAVINATLALATAAVTGAEYPSGAITAAMYQTIVGLSAAQTQSGSLAAQLLQAVAALAGTWVAPPSFASAGAGAVQSSTGTVSISWTHAIESDATMIIIPVMWSTNNQFSPVLKIGATVINATVDYYYNFVSGTTNDHMMLFVFPLAGTGLAGTTQTFNFTSGAVAGSKRARGNSFTYRNCLSVGVSVQTGATSAAASHTVSTAAPVVFQYFGGYTTTSAISFSSYSQTSRWNQPSTTAPGPMLVGDAAVTGGSVVFSASVTSEPWGSVSLELNST